MAARKKVTDRALRYRAQAAVTGAHVCVICGRKGKPGRGPDGLDVMHLDGDESHGEQKNLAYGCRKCNAGLAAAFKRIGAGRLTRQYNPGKVPTYDQYAWAVAQQRHSGDHGDAGAVIHATPKHKRIEYARRILDLKTSRDTRYRSPAWMRENPGAPGEAFKRCVRSVAAKGTADDPKAVCAAAGRKKYGKAAFQKMAAAGKRRAARKNPAAASAEAFEEFHGYPPDEVITVQKKLHFHKHLAAAGELVGLAVRPANKRIPEQHIEDLGGAYLAFNEDKNQLFIEGGSQYLSTNDLKALGIEEPHELETLGKLIAVGYYTNKKHLGDDGGEAVYDHIFRTTNENGRHVVVEIARYPDLIYRVRDEQFEISGGSYIIRAEGIDR